MAFIAMSRTDQAVEAELDQIGEEAWWAAEWAKITETREKFRRHLASSGTGVIGATYMVHGEDPSPKTNRFPYQKLRWGGSDFTLLDSGRAKNAERRPGESVEDWRSRLGEAI